MYLALIVVLCENFKAGNFPGKVPIACHTKLHNTDCTCIRSVTVIVHQYPYTMTENDAYNNIMIIIYIHCSLSTIVNIIIRW